MANTNFVSSKWNLRIIKTYFRNCQPFRRFFDLNVTLLVLLPLLSSSSALRLLPLVCSPLILLLHLLLSPPPPPFFLSLLWPYCTPWDPRLLVWPLLLLSLLSPSCPHRSPVFLYSLCFSSLDIRPHISPPYCIVLSSP